jgi:predicted DNA-binding helix-hairpin-helix protein
LLISRIVELRQNQKYTVERIVETLRQVECSHEFQNYWLFNYIDEVTEDIKTVFGMDFSKKRMTLQEIKQNLGSAKKI